MGVMAIDHAWYGKYVIKMPMTATCLFECWVKIQPTKHHTVVHVRTNGPMTIPNHLRDGKHAYSSPPRCRLRLYRWSLEGGTPLVTWVRVFAWRDR